MTLHKIICKFLSCVLSWLVLVKWSVQPQQINVVCGGIATQYVLRWHFDLGSTYIMLVKRGGKGFAWPQTRTVVLGHASAIVLQVSCLFPMTLHTPL